MTKLFNEKSAFNHTDETYIGTWFGFDIYLYNSSGVPNLLAVFGNEPGQYSTWIGDERWFAEGAVMGVAAHGTRIFGAHELATSHSVPMEEHLTTNDLSKAFLMGFAALWARNGGDISQYAPDRSYSFLRAAEKIHELSCDIVMNTPAPVQNKEQVESYYFLAKAALDQAEHFMRLAQLNS